MEIIILNGPPRSGKDSIAKYLEPYDFINIKFSRVLKDAAHALYGLNVEYDHFESGKDSPQEEFYGLTPREVYINLSELYFKPMHGKNIFATLGAKSIQNQIEKGKTRFVITDLGFELELDEMLKIFGADSLYFFYVMRPGASFKNDSRTFMPIYTLFHNNIPFSYIHNREGIEELNLKVRKSFEKLGIKLEQPT